MKIKFKFNRKYFIWFLILFSVELLIALFVRDKFIRPFIGDLLVVILIYTFLKSFLSVKPTIAMTAVWLFACFVEFLQYLKLTEKLNLEKGSVAAIVIGSTFDWMDILAYTVGILIIFIVERKSS